MCSSDLIRASLNVSPAKEADLSIRGQKTIYDSLCKNENYLKRLVKLGDIQFGEKVEKPAQSATAVVKGLEIFVPLAGLIDINKEIDRLEKQIENIEGRLKSVTQKLDNDSFVSRAPEEVVSHERKKQEGYQSDLTKLQQNLEALQL